MDWFLANLETVYEITVQVVGVAALIATVTPNTSDDAVVDALLKFINVLGLNIGNASNR